MIFVMKGRKNDPFPSVSPLAHRWAFAAIPLAALLTITWLLAGAAGPRSTAGRPSVRAASLPPSPATGSCASKRCTGCEQCAMSRDASLLVLRHHARSLPW